MAKQPKINRTFHQDLILNHWAISLFYCADMPEFSRRLSDVKEGISENGQSYFFEKLTEGLFNPNKISEQDLRRYDLNIIQHWQKITERRNQQAQELHLKYFQYLLLLFTEIYLDRFFNQSEQLIQDLNRFLTKQQAEDKSYPKFQPFILDDLNKIAFWSATGSGKTLLMHVNILQYQHYFSQKQGDKLPIFLLTPNEGLSYQHLKEFEESNLSATIFDKQRGIGLFDEIQILDIHKLAEKDGEKTIAVDAFESPYKLVLVDEGHRGNSGDSWLNLRNKLVGNGFSFEYSATFGQSIKERKSIAEKLKKNLSEETISEERQKNLFEIYAKSILFDYSYKYFYKDGYGKESFILNLAGDDIEQEDNDKKYFLAGLLAFYQQLYVFAKYHQNLTAYNLEKPLWVFVGSKVNNEESDVLQVLEYLAYFVNNPEQIQRWLQLLLDGKAFLDKNGDPILKTQYDALFEEWKENMNGLYQDILRKLFNAEHSQRLNLVNLKKANGELALRLGSYPPFGVINIGDDNKFFNQASNNHYFDTINDDFSEGLFQQINSEKSAVNLLIGSKKFTEGWSSWRVSTMGLLNIGRSEGSQIIQLFGRGVRLKGKDFSLKRSQKNEFYLNKLETLMIFGVKANYMEQFKTYLREEDVPMNDEMITINFNTTPFLPQGIKLKTLKLKDGYKDNQRFGFKRQQIITLYDVPEKYQHIKKVEAVLDLYPRLDALSTQGTVKSLFDVREEHKLDAALFPFFDWDKIYLSLLTFKMQKTWFNLQLSKEKLRSFVENNQDWYQLYLPKEALAVNDFSAVFKQEAILIELLKLYTEKFYQRLKSAYENEHLHTAEIEADYPALSEKYLFSVTEDGAARYDAKLNELKKYIENSDLKKAISWISPDANLHAIIFEPHLYQPLFNVDEMENLPFKLSPLLLKEESEIKWIEDLMSAQKNGELQQWIGDCDLYLLRNPANKAKGLGFSLAGNFYPDFLLWLVNKNTGKQYLSFIDPKGIRQLHKNDVKFALHEEVKTLQAKIADPNLCLSAFILSITKQDELIADYSAEELNQKHILFMHDNHYLSQLFAMILGDK